MSVVVGYGATEESEAALAEAGREALRRGTELHVLALGSEAAIDVGTRLAQGAPSWTLHDQPEHQGVADAVLDLAAEVGAEVIVVGARRRSPVGKLLLGSAVQEILLASEVPVLLVKP